MKTQTNFDNLIQLLKSKGARNVIVEELLNHCLETEITFSSFNESSNRMTKEHMLDIYEFRAEMEEERKENPFVFGYEKLMPAFRITPNEYICVSDITSDLGSFIIFTDYELTDFVGILKSKRTLTEIRKNYSDHKSEVEKSGEHVIDDYENSEVVFIDGKIKLSR